MKLAISNIAWTNEEEPEVAELLSRLGVRYVEVAPTKKWKNPKDATSEEIHAYKSFWEAYGIEVVAFQSMLFNRPDLKIFESARNRQATLDYLKDYIALAGKMGVGIMVFGSPKNRQRGGLDPTEAKVVAKDFFSELGRVADERDVWFCIEPNASQYACDFVTKAQEGVNLVKEVSTPGFGLHLDIACMALAGDSISDSIINAAPVLQHFHISSPMLDAVEGRPDVDHASAAVALRGINYQKFVSIEMRPGELGTNIARVERAVRFAQATYFPQQA